MGEVKPTEKRARARAPRRSSKSGAVFCALGLGLACVGGPPMQEALRGRVQIFEPKKLEVLSEPFVRLVGRAGPARRAGLDLILAFELPPEARSASGGDIDGDGVVGQNARSEDSTAAVAESDDAGDSIASALGIGAIEMARQLPVADARVGLVTYAGDASTIASALDAAPGDRDATLRDLATAVATEAVGGSSVFAEPIARSVNHLIDLQPAGTPPRRSVVLLLVLGEPYRKLGTRIPERGLLATSGAMAGADGIEIYPVLIGKANESILRALTLLAAPSGGVVMQIPSASDLPRVMPLLHLSGIEALTVQNKTRGDEPARVPFGRDGEFATDIPLVAGENEIEVVARRFGGETYAATRTVRFER